jgi:hypothetical protein
LPDGIFSNQKSQFGYILKGLRIENVGVVYGNLEYFTAIGYILRPLGNVMDNFPRFGMYIVSRKICQPCFLEQD